MRWGLALGTEEIAVGHTFGWGFSHLAALDGFEALRAEQERTDARLVAFVHGLAGEPALDEIVDLERRDHVQHEKVGDVLLHLFEHQIHHRGQVHAMLAGTSVAPPQLDEFFMTAEAPLRADDFKALGWTEDDVWR